MNKTDPDSRMMRTQGQPTVQGYNVQAAVTREQIIVAAEIAVESPDFGNLEPAARAALCELENAGVTQRLETVLADAGYWHTRQMENIVSDGIQVLVPPDAGLREGVKPGMGQRSLRVHAPGARQRRRTRALQAPQSDGRAGVRAEQFNRGFRRFQRRGRAAVRSEWRLQAAVHNLLKLHSHWISPATA